MREYLLPKIISIVPSIHKLFILFLVGISLCLFSINPVYSQTTSPSLTPKTQPNKNQQKKELEDKVTEYQNKVTELQKQSTTLSSQLKIMDIQIVSTEQKIQASKAELTEVSADISVATQKVTKLESSLDEITKVLLNRIIRTYQVGQVQPVELFFSSGNISNLMTRSTYLTIIQENDKKLTFQTQQARNDYQNQKELFELQKKKVEIITKQLLAFESQLEQEKKAKQILLDTTKNDEKKYQSLLAQARTEYEAIQGIVAGNGTETEVGQVNEGDTIASIIPGTSCNSGGAHLHFIVSKNGSTQSPFNYLKPTEFENCSGSSCGSSDGDPFNPTGAWNWPIEPQIKMTQGYGSTWAVRNTYVGRIYNSHSGIDITSQSLTVKAVQSGVLYKGSYGGSCRLPYVRVRHADGLDTFYLHINYAS